MWTDLNLFCHANAYAVGGFKSLLACGTVGISRIYNQRTHQPLSTAEMLAPYRYGRSNDLIAGKHGCGGSAIWSQRQR